MNPGAPGAHTPVDRMHGSRDRAFGASGMTMEGAHPGQQSGRACPLCLVEPHRLRYCRSFLPSTASANDQPHGSSMHSPNVTGPLGEGIHGVGEPMLRTEDPKLVRGAGCYTDDINRPNQAYAAIVRSTHAHGRIRGIDTSAARAMPGVLAVITGADLTEYGPIRSGLPFKNRDGSDMIKPYRPAIPTDKVRFVGDPVACVVAETIAQAKDAAEAVVRRYRAAAGRHQAGRCGAPRCAADLRRGAGQCRARLSLRRCRESERGFRARGPCDQGRTRQQPRRRQCHGAARGDCRIRFRERTLHPAHRKPGRDGHARAGRRAAQGRAGEDARHHPECRRLVRDEGFALSRISVHPACRARCSGGR